MNAIIPSSSNHKDKKHENNSSEFDDNHTTTSDNSSLTKSSGSVIVEGPPGAIPKAKLRLVFHDSLHVWHCLVRPGRGAVQELLSFNVFK